MRNGAAAKADLRRNFFARHMRRRRAIRPGATESPRPDVGNRPEALINLKERRNIMKIVPSPQKSTPRANRLKLSAEVDAALKNWRRRGPEELRDLALAVKRAAGRGLHLSERQWRLVEKVEAAAAIAAGH
jgi:hypothetical protein